MLFALLLTGKVQANPPRIPTVTAQGDDWVVTGAWGTSRFPRAGERSARPMIDIKDQRIVLPTLEEVRALSFSGKQIWSVILDSSWDPRPLLCVGQVVVIGLNRSVWPSNPSREKGFGITASFQTIPNLAVDIRTGKTLWRRSEFDQGTVLGSLNGRSLLDVRISNPDDFFSAKAPAHLAFDVVDLKSGKRRHTWYLRRPQEELAWYWGEAPGPSANDYIAISTDSRGILITFPGGKEIFGNEIKPILLRLRFRRAIVIG